MTPLRAAMLLCLAAAVLSVGSSPAGAAEIDTDTGCGADRVEVCFPVCVTAPCPGYVCYHSSQGSVCRELWV